MPSFKRTIAKKNPMVPPKGVQPIAQRAGVRNSPGAAPQKIGADNSATYKVVKKQSDLQALPILRNPDNERALVKHVLERLRLSDIERGQRIQRCTDIDIMMSGFVKLDADDTKRKRDNKRGKPPKPTAANLTFTQAQISECVAYLMGVFAPESNIFIATSRADKQAAAEGLTDEINKHGQLAGYYRQFVKAMKNALKYNFSGITCYWEKYNGQIFEAIAGGASGQIAPKDGVVWEGNMLKSVDVYNFFFDTTVHPCDLPRRGEYFAEVERKTPFNVRKMQEDGKLFGVDRWIDMQTTIPITGNSTIVFYQTPPSVRDNTGNADRGRTNWQAILSPDGPAPLSQPSVELVYFTTWINPSLFGLSANDKLELWRITVAQGTYIANAVQLDSTHGLLPVAMGCPIEDDLINEQRTYAEQLQPLNDLCSFLMNSHVTALRKAIYGITLYNPHLFPGLDKCVDDIIGAMIPMKSTSSNVDIDKAFRHYSQKPETSQNIQEIGEIAGLMQKILPTNQAQQVADLERATEYQAAATVQASNRTNLVIARMLNDQCFTPLKFMMLYNIYRNITQIEFIGGDGKPVQVSPKDLVDAQIELDIGTGLRGLDRLMQLAIFKDIFGLVVQNAQSLQELDIVKMLNYFMQLAGDKTDLDAFRKALPPPVQATGVQEGGPQPPAVLNPAQANNANQQTRT